MRGLQKRVVSFERLFSGGGVGFSEVESASRLHVACFSPFTRRLERRRRDTSLRYALESGLLLCERFDAKLGNEFHSVRRTHMDSTGSPNDTEP